MTREEVMLEVREAMSRNGQRIELEQITANTAMSQEAGIDGIDVYDFAKDLERTFGEIVWTTPWGRFSDQRASFYGCSTVLAPFWMLWRLLTWPIHGEFIPLPNGGEERLTVDHLTEVLWQGHRLEAPGVQL